MKKTLTDSEMMELRSLGYLGGATIGDLIEFRLRYPSKWQMWPSIHSLMWSAHEELIDGLYREIQSILKFEKANNLDL